MKAYFQLLRLPNIVTSAADVLAGVWIMAAITEIIQGSMAWLIVSSCLLYSGGVALNDVVDVAIDAMQRPERPIPSGKVSRKRAALLASYLLIGGLIAAWMSSFLSFMIAIVLVGTIIFYNGWAKKSHTLGSIVMGLCRSINLLLGFSIAPHQIWHYAFLLAFPFFHIVSVTSLSQGETTGLSQRHVLFLTAVPMGLAILLFVLGLQFQASLSVVFIFIVLYLLGEGFALIPAIRRPEPFLIGRGVKYGLLSLILLNAALVAIFSGGFQAMMTASLFIIPWLIARWFSMT
ncbi:UbiA-like protein EboC [Aneurinibacillus sp. Ricciae_BoGa-3]|uniref:UbiA-like protein EboC n=1 Tax=Aneurinibacillus sp. Ricciae_BoGa-3 TaxID=3022697 RepID=UPI00233FFFED|nr:UbiA-like protein EboC [Aneurinibacillus sp. Ricciae_BoGa-3]WCK56302.1 UbiA-like protein EboC [Aneurinibacillus sp. Ricciae_BoGa-3]